MKTINRTTAHKHVVSNHETMKWMTENGRLTVRKTAGRYVVTLEDFYNHNVTKKSFATLPGALVCADNLREYFL